MVKKTFLLFVSLVLLLCSGMSTVRAAPPEITADSALVMEDSTGQVIYEINGYERRPTASTTKILTAMVALENADLNETVEVSEVAAATGGSSMWLKAGEKLTMEELLYGLMLPSGNDAAVAIAEHVAGSVPEFMEKMNLRADELGARNTYFQNPHGLPDDNHFTTAYDLCVISRTGFKNPCSVRL